MKNLLVHKAWIGLGSNLGDRRSNLASASGMLLTGNCKLIASSAIYESASWGYESENSFLNQCLVIETHFSPEELLLVLQGIEHDMGRERLRGKYTDRIIDLDILFYDDLVLDSLTLNIPHPEIENRNFVLSPLAEISPEKRHPVTGITMKVMAEHSADKIMVRKLPGE